MLPFTLHGMLRVYCSRIAWEAVGSSYYRRECRGHMLLNVVRKMATTSSVDDSSVRNITSDGQVDPNEVDSIIKYYRSVSSPASSPLDHSFSSDIVNSAAQQFARGGEMSILWRMLADQLGCPLHRRDVAKTIVGYLYVTPRISLNQSTVVTILRTCLRDNMREGWAWYRALRTLFNQTLFSACGPKVIQAENLLFSLLVVAGMAARPEECAIRARQVFLDEVLPANIILPPASIALLLQLTLALPRQQHSELLFSYIIRVDFTPSVEICEAFVAQFCEGEMYDLVPEGLKLLLRAGRPSVSFYNNTLELYTKHQHAAADMILEHMKASHILPNLDTLAILLRAGLPNLMELFALGEEGLSKDPRKEQVTRFCSDLVVALYKHGVIEELYRILSRLAVYGADQKLVYTALCRALETNRDNSPLAKGLFSHISQHNSGWEEWLRDESFTLALVRALTRGKGFGAVRKVLLLLKQANNVEEEVLVLCHVCDVCAITKQTELIGEFFDALRSIKTWHESSGWKKFRLVLLEGVDLKDVGDYKTISGKLEVMSLLVIAPPSRLMLPFLHTLLAAFVARYRFRHMFVWNAVTRSYFRYLSLCRPSRLSVNIETLNALLDCLILEMEVGLALGVDSPSSFQRYQQDSSRLAQLSLAACQWIIHRTTPTASSSSLSVFPAPSSLSSLSESSASLVDQMRLVGSSEVLQPSRGTWLKTITVLALARPFLPKEQFRKYREVIRKEAFTTHNSREEGMEGLGLLYILSKGPKAVYEKEDALEAVKLFRDLRSYHVEFSEEDFVCGMLRGLRQLQSQMWAVESTKEIYYLAKSCVAEFRQANPPLSFTNAISAQLIQLAGRDTLFLGQVFAICQQDRLNLDLSLCVALIQAAAQPSDITTMLRYIRGQDAVDNESDLMSPVHVDIPNSNFPSATVELTGNEENQLNFSSDGSELSSESSLEQRLRSTGDDERLVAYFNDLEPFKVENNKEPKSNDKRFSFRHIWSAHLKGSLSEL